MRGSKYLESEIPDQMLLKLEGEVTMGSNTVLFGWKRSIPGREKLSAQHFGEFVAYLGGLQQKGAIQTLKPCSLTCTEAI
jgi:hypothetical protein